MMSRTIVTRLNIAATATFAIMLCANSWAADAAPDKAAPEKAKAVSTLVLPAVKVDTPENKHFINKWLVLGNFIFDENDFGGDPQKDANNKEFIPNEAALDGTQPAPKGTKWEEKAFDDQGSAGKIDLGADINHAAAYCVAWVNVPETITDAKLLIGSDDYVKIWINGKLVHSYNTDRRSAEADQDTATGITLNKGENRVVVKCVNILYAWEFYLRFTDKDGNAFAVK